MTPASKGCHSPVTTVETSIRAIIVRHVESYQTPNEEEISASEYSLLFTQHAASKLKEELESEIFNDCFANSITMDSQDTGIIHEESDGSRSIADQGEKQILKALLDMIQAALAAVVSSKTSSAHALRKATFYESTGRVLDFIAVFSSMPSAVKGCNSSGDSGIDNDSLAEKVLNFVSQCAIVDMESIRLLACDFIGRYIQNLSYHKGEAQHGADGNLIQKKEYANQDCWRAHLQTASDVLCPRLEDKSVAVRSAALESCSRFFEKQQSQLNDEDEMISSFSNDYDHIIEAMIFNLAHDTSFANRSLAVKSIPITKETVPLIVERIKDAKVKVRVDALNVLRKKVNVRDLSLEHRVEILRSGLTDRCPETYTATTQMICSGWMKAVKFDPITFLRLLDPPTSETISQLAAKVLLGVACSDYTTEDNQLLDKALVDLSQNEVQAYKDTVLQVISISDNDEQDLNLIDPATILFVRVICDLTINSNTMTEVKRANKLSRIMPDIPVLGGILEKHASYLNQCANNSFEHDNDTNDYDEREDKASFVCLQLLQLARIADLKEEGSRRHFSSIIHRMLCSPNTHGDLIEDCVLVSACCHDTESHFLQAIAEILADTIDSDESIASPDIEIREKQYIRAMEILSVVLENISPRIASNPTFQNFSDLILSSITDTRLGSFVRQAGVSCLGRYAILLDENIIIDTFKPLLMNVAFREDETSEIRAQAMLNIADLTILFDRMQAPILLTNINPVETSVNDLLLQTISCSNKALVIVAAECAAKLLFAGKLHDVNIVAQLTMTYFDRDFAISDVDERSDEVEEVGSPARLQQLLTLFFPAYCMRTKTGRETLTASIDPLLTLVNEKMTAHRNGKKQTVWPIAKMVEYICMTLDEGENGEMKEDPVDSINENKMQIPSIVLVTATTISKFLIREGEDLHISYIRSLSKILGKVYVDVKTEDPSSVGILKSNVDELSMFITDNIALRSLKNLVEILEDFEINYESEDESEGESVSEGVGDSESESESEDIVEDRISLASKNFKRGSSKRYKEPELSSEGGKNTSPLRSGNSLVEALERVDLDGKGAKHKQIEKHTENSPKPKSKLSSLSRCGQNKFEGGERKTAEFNNSTNDDRRVENEIDGKIFKKKATRHDNNIPHFASIGGDKINASSAYQNRIQKRRTKEADYRDLTDSENSSSSNSDLSEYDSDSDNDEYNYMKENVDISLQGRRTSNRIRKIQKQKILESEDDDSTESEASESLCNDLSEDSTCSIEKSKNIKGKKTKTPVLRRAKRKEITPLNKGRTPMRPRRKLADVNY